MHIQEISLIGSLNKYINSNLVDKIVFCNEGHFHHDDFINTHDCHTCQLEDPRMNVEQEMRLTVSYAMGSGGIIRQFFFEDDQNHP